jgi:hypothetical protein
MRNVLVILRHVHETIVAMEKQYVSCVSVCVCVCVCAVALVPYLPRMQSTCAVLSSVTTLDPKYILTPHKHHDFRKKSF